ncbi:MAG: PAS domain-containing protein, partial [Ktedonobacterales bacterium]
MASRDKPHDEAPSAHPSAFEHRAVASTVAEDQSARRFPGDQASIAIGSSPNTIGEPMSAFALVVGQFTWAADARGHLTERIAWTIYTGQSPQESAGDGWLDAVHTDDRASLRESWFAAVATTTPSYKAMLRVRRADGAYAPVLIRAVPVADAATGVGGWIGTCVELTEASDLAPALTRSDEPHGEPHGKPHGDGATRDQLADAEAARRLAEERAAFLSTTLESLSDGLVITDADGCVLFGNAAYTALLGAESNDNGLSEHVPSRLSALNARNARGEALREQDLAVARALRGETIGGADALDVRIRRLDGQEAFLSITGAPVRDADGALIGAVMALRDVTERRQLGRRAREANRVARERAARLEAIFASVADGLFVYDVDGRIVERNPAADAVLAEYAPPESYGESVYERTLRVGGLRDHQGHILARDEWPQARIARGETLSGATSVDVRMRNRAGQETDLNVSGAPLRDERGAIVGSVCVYRDVTERWRIGESLGERTRALEETNTRLRTLLDVLPIGVAIADAQGKGIELNAAFRRIWGADAPLPEGVADYGEYRGWWTATGEALRAEDWAMARALATGEIVSGDEVEIETFTGERKVALNTAAPLRDSSGAIIGGISAMLDMTEQKIRSERTREALDSFIAITRALVEAPEENASEDHRTADEALYPDSDEDTRAQRRVAHRLAVLTRGILGCSRVSISAVEGEPPVSRAVVVVGFTPEQEAKWRREQQAQPPQEVGAGLTPEDRERLLAGESLTIDVTRPPYLIPNDYGVTAVLAAPMRAQGRLVGLLGLDFQSPGNQPHLFTAEEIQIAEAVARLGAVVLEHERLLRERAAARAEALALTEANRRMDEFLGIAGHELRTPLTTVKANLQLAERRMRNARETSPGRAERDDEGRSLDQALK